MTRPLKVGVQLPEVEWVPRWADIREMAQVAEEIGLDSIWVGDHLLYRYEDGPSRGPWEAWTQLAAVAAVTEKIQLGPLVAATSFHSPAMIAKKAATLEEISGGRLILGLGAGWNEPDYTAYGFPYDHRVSRFEEAFTIIRTLLHDGRCDYSGAYYTITDAELIPRGPRPHGPPLLVGSDGPRMLSITLPWVQSWNAWFTWYGNSPEGYPPLRDKIDAACREAGRDPVTLERTLAVLVAMPGAEHVRQGSHDRAPVDAMSGDPEVLVPGLRAFAEMGVGHVQLVLDPITADSIRALAPTIAALDA
ncbi:MAG TPA: LLM class flavin-dependent oxidoreductase [Candidatus Limnocylindria bacterium]